jgi:hypothetical protein
VLVAKFTLGALAMGDYWYGGRTRNPWNTNTGSSGSSAGSASATAAGLIPFAIGTETWGSIISPASTCGLSGLRPTFGSISRSGGMTLSWSLDKIGPICRSAADAAMVFAFIHGTDGADANAVNARFDYQQSADARQLRIGYAKNYFDQIKDTSRNEWKVLATFKKMGVELIPVNSLSQGNNSGPNPNINVNVLSLDNSDFLSNQYEVNTEEVSNYFILKNINIYDPPKSLIPIYNSVLPTKTNYQNGEFRRYFCKKTNEIQYIEIDIPTYNRLVAKDPQILWQLYKPFNITWHLTGNVADVARINFNAVELASKTKGLPMLGDYLKSNYIKYYI